MCMLASHMHTNHKRRVYIHCRAWVRSPTHTHPPSVIPMCDHVHHTNRYRLHISHQDIKFSDASEVVRANKSRITYDEFEYDTTSVRKIGPLRALHQYQPFV